MATQAFRWYCCVAAIAAAVFPFVPGAVQNSLYLFASASVLVAVWWGLRIHRPSSRAPWLLLAAGLSCSLLGDLGFDLISAYAPGEVPFPSVLDAVYLMFYPLLYLSIGRLLKTSAKPDPAAWVDATIWTIGVAAVLWEPLIKPYVLDAEAGFVGYAVALAYPLLDLGLLLMVLRLVAGRRSISPSYLLLTSAMLVQVVVDSVYGVRVLQGSYQVGELTDVGWMVINLLLGGAALHPSMVRLTAQRTHSTEHWSRFRLPALLIPALAAPALLVFQLLTAAPTERFADGLFTGGAVALLLTLVMARAAGLLRVADRRSKQLTQRTAALEVALADRERISCELATKVNQDGLTGLASRGRFVDTLRSAVDSWRTGGDSPSVAFLDLDDFKAINDTLGHEAGDLLLIEVGRRLQRGAGDGQLVARFGGDEFAVLLHGDPEQSAARLVELLQHPVLVYGREIRPQVSIGITTARHRRSSASDLLREADIAMYAAKRAGGGWASYQPGMSTVLLERLDVRNRLLEALRVGAIEPWYQPVVDLATGRLLGFEALARWPSDGATGLRPDEWLPTAEESGIIVEVDRAIFRAAIAQLAAWRRDAPHSELELSVNLSGRTLLTPGIEDEVILALQSNGVPAHRLTVEVTEGVLIEDEQVGGRLQRLRNAGVRIALDDFGTGYSSLSYLRRFPVDHLKLDRSFTADLNGNPEGDTIPAAIVQLARGMSLGVVAEGVETQDQCQRLIKLGFRVGQGYLFGRAQRAADLHTQVLASRPLLDSAALDAQGLAVLNRDQVGRNGATRLRIAR